MPRDKQKKIAVINDFSGFGRCSIAVALPIISALKIQCCPLPTAIFSNHTGFDSFFFTDYTRHMNAYMDEWKKLDLRFDGILTGFLSSVEQIDHIKRFFDLFYDEKTIAVVDPVMGDSGKLYATYTIELAKSLSSLLPLADVITPNLTEACVLADVDYRPDVGDDELLKLCEKLSAYGPKKIVVTGLERGDVLSNYVFERDSPPVIVNEPRIGVCRSGTGDVFSAIIAADAVNGKDFAESVRRASSFIAKAMRRTMEKDVAPQSGVCFEEILLEL
ncbi:MAG: pyridoxamine kinase [Thermoguttaceae bacterium]|nr:pyridoxamine kinase [Thermoguttaceae bacterium]